MKVLVTGHAGMLGSDIVTVFKSNGHEVFGVDLNKNTTLDADHQYITDLTDEKTLIDVLAKSNPEVIIHCAAIVSLDLCESNKELADAIHVRAASILANYRPLNSKLLYISTDSVFDGKKGFYTENDVPSAINYYAKSKIAGEQTVLYHENTLVIRTNIFGFNNPLKNSLAEWAIKNIINREKIVGFDDIIFNAIYTKDLARILLYITTQDISGIINIACNGEWSKFDFLENLVLHLNMNHEYLIRGNSSQVNFLIDRPQKTNLVVSKVSSIIPMPSLIDSVIHFCNDYKTDFYENR